ncbi:hypothetical protein WA577_000141 [Blastocystis sp. JDR]
MLLSLLLLCTASCIQYVPIPYSIDPIDISALSFNESFVSKSSNGPFQRIDLSFEFHFYDRILRQVWISPNGFISLKPGVRCYGFYATDDCDLESVEYDAFIAPYLTSLNPSRGGSTTSILYRIDDSRLIVIWNHVPTLNLEYRNSFMVILHADGEVVFCYKDFKWPFASTEFYIHGLIGIRPFLSDSYSTKGSYISSWREQWNSNRMGNYANPSDIDAIYQRLFQPRDYVFDYVELFALAPTEICITPSVVSAHQVTNITLHYSWLSSTLLSSSHIRCVLGGNDSVPIVLLSPHSLLCLNADFSFLNVSQPVSIRFSLQFVSPFRLLPLTTLTTSSLTVLPTPLTPTPSCDVNGSCDRCGLCINATLSSSNTTLSSSNTTLSSSNTTLSSTRNTLLSSSTTTNSTHNACVGVDDRVYGRSDSDCPAGMIRDAKAACCDPTDLDCNDVCKGGGVLAWQDPFTRVCCEASSIDCAGVCAGLAQSDDCGVCSGGTSEHVANSEQDCDGVCFGPKTEGCPVFVEVDHTVVHFHFDKHALVLAHNISLSNRGGYAALLFSQTSVPWKHEDQPALQFRWFLQDREVNLMKEPIPPGASVILTVEGSMTAIHAPVSVVRGYRQSQTIQFQFVPLTRNETEGAVYSIHVDFDYADCNELTEYRQCVLHPGCYACVFDIDGSSYNDYFVHPFSVQSMQSEPYLMMCIHGSSENCSSLLPEAERESWKRKYSLSSIPWGSLEVVCFLVVLVVILLIVLFNIVSIRNDIHFLESLFSLD